MSGIATARERIRNGYSQSGYEVVDRLNGALAIRHSGGEVPILPSDIEMFAKNLEFLSDAAPAPVDCSVCTPTLREHLAAPVGSPARLLLGSARGEWFLRENEDVDSGVAVRVGPATDLFVDFFRFDAGYLQLCRRRLDSMFGEWRDAKTLREALPRPTTVQVTGLNEPSVTAAVARSNDIIETALFTLSYAKSRTVQLLPAWPTERTLSRQRPFSFTERHPGQRMPLPKVRYNSEVLKFYQLGMSSDVPEMQFIAFYQVLEYFFIAVSDERLYGQLTRRTADPDFRPMPHHWDRIIQDVSAHTKLDELDMLRAVLAKFVDETDLIDFIKTYESHLGEPWYTKKRSRFGLESEIKLQAGHAASNAGAILRAVRNAIVHSSDRFERIGRHVPFSSSSLLVEREVPLAKYVAERVVIGSAQPR